MYAYFSPLNKCGLIKSNYAQCRGSVRHVQYFQLSPDALITSFDLGSAVVSFVEIVRSERCWHHGWQLVVGKFTALAEQKRCYH